MADDYKYTGTLLRRSEITDFDGASLMSMVRKAVADHRRLLVGPAQRVDRLDGRFGGELAGKREAHFDDGTVITTWVNPFGLAKTIAVRVDVVGQRGVIRSLSSLMMDHGWMVWGVLPDDDRVIYVHAELQAYYNGDGTLIPDGARYEHLARKLLITEVVDGNSLGWKEKPVLSVDNSYVIGKTEPLEAKPHISLFTGEARLMAQAEWGSRNTITFKLPSSWTLLPQDTGIFWAPNGKLWAVKVSGRELVYPFVGNEYFHNIYPDGTPTAGEMFASVTINMVELQVPEQYQDLVIWMMDLWKNAGQQTLDVALLKSWIMAIASATDESPVYTFEHTVHWSDNIIETSHVGAPSLHINPLYKWQFFWQVQYGSIARAVMAIAGYADTGNYFSTTILDFTIAFNIDGIPTGITQKTPRGPKQWSAKYFRFYLPIDPNVLEVYPFEASVAAVEGSTPAMIYVFTNTEGGANAVWSAGEIGGGIVNLGTGSYPTFCGPGGFSDEERGSFTRIAKGGYYMTAYDGCVGNSINAVIDVRATQTTSKYTVNISGGAVVSFAWPQPTKVEYILDNPPTQSCSGGIDQRWSFTSEPMYEGSEWTVTYGVGEYTYDTFGGVSGSGGAALLFSPTDNGITLIKQQNWGNPANPQYHKTYYYIEPNDGTRWHTWDVTNKRKLPGVPLDFSSAGTVMHTGSPGTSGQLIYYNGSWINKIIGGGYSSNPTVYPNILTELMQVYETGFAAFCGSNNEVHMLDPEDWDHLAIISSGTPPAATPPYMSVTALGEIIYSEAPGGELSLPAGLSDEVKSAVRIASVGAV